MANTFNADGYFQFDYNAYYANKLRSELSQDTAKFSVYYAGELCGYCGRMKQIEVIAERILPYNRTEALKVIKTQSDVKE